MSTIGNNLFAQYWAQNQGLPFGYEVVEYLENDTTNYQYIDTGVYLGNELGYEIIFQIPENNGTTTIPIGTRSPGANDRHWINFSNNAMTYGWGTYHIPTPSFPSSLIKDKLIGRVNFLNDRKASINGSYTYNIGNALVNTQLITTYLFLGREYDGSVLGENNYMRIWSCRITRGDEVIRDFIPCVRLSDNKPGMYDLCRSICPLTGNSFYINAGTGEFSTP